MAGKMSEVSAFEAKTRLSELLRETERGRSFVIRRRGKVVGRLVPPGDPVKPEDSKRLLTAFRELRKRVRGRVKVRELVEAGRRF